jgi:uncharacterized protein (TIGR03663 family)
MKGWLIWALMILAAGAWLLRAPQLDRRPLHNDEGVNAWVLRDLVEQGKYRYNPEEYHGPTLHYLSLPFVKFWPAESRMSDANLRVAPVVFGGLLILLLALVGQGLGRTATLAAGLLLAISPAFVFYSRYFIHEIFFVFFGMLALGAGWRYGETGKLVWALTCGAGIGLMYATKETYVFHAGAMGAAALAVGWWNARQAGQPLCAQSWWNVKHWAMAAVVGMVVAELFFTSFLTNLRGAWDAILTYEPWFKRAGVTSPHNHAWYFYFERLFWFHPAKSPVWSEGVVLVLALVGAGAAFLRKPITGVNVSLARFLVIYTGLLTLVYSVIPYKTPWCLLGFYHGMILVAGIGVACLFEMCRPRWLRVALVCLLSAAAGQLGWQAWRSGHPVMAANAKGQMVKVDFSASSRNPYVYSQTSPNMLEVVAKVEAVARVHPDGTNMLVKVMSYKDVSPWPLPWYLRRLGRVGWWDELPADPYAPVMLVNSKYNATLDEKSGKKYLMVGLYEMRPDFKYPPRTFLEMYVELELWKRYVETLPKNRDEDDRP